MKQILNESTPQSHPTAEGAEEMSAREYLDKWMDEHHHLSDRLIGWSVAADFAEDFATLHAQKIADKMKEANQFILDIAKIFGIETDGVGYDGLQLSIDDFKEAAEKMVEEKFIEFGKMIRDEPNGDIPALAEYFIRTINLKPIEP